MEPTTTSIETREAHELLLRQARRFLLFTLALAVIFHRPLWELLRYSASSDIFSYIPLIPCISGYLVWSRRHELPSRMNGSRRGALVPFAAGAAFLIAYWTMWRAGWGQDTDRLSLLIPALLLFFVGGCWQFFGSGLVRATGFSLALLVLMVPLPAFLAEWLARSLQYASAEVSYAMLKMAGEPVFRQGLFFQLPGISLRVAEECSGIRSSIVLFITSLLAGHLFLSNCRYKTVLALAAIPLGIIRNGFRIFIIALLCVHVDPAMIDSPLHRRGGPVFFILSIFFLFFLLVVLRRAERSRVGGKKIAVPKTGQELAEYQNK